MSENKLMKVRYLDKAGFGFKFEDILNGGELVLKVFKDKDFKDSFQEGKEYKLRVNGEWINECEPILKKGDDKQKTLTTTYKETPVQQTIPQSNKTQEDIKGHKMTTSEYEEKGFINLKGKWCAPFKTLLNEAHHVYKNNFSIKTKLLEFNIEKKYAIFMAQIVIQTENGEQIFTGYGDSFQDNTGQLTKGAYIRMAETRAIVRALRFATNIAEVGSDEL